MQPKQYIDWAFQIKYWHLTWDPSPFKKTLTLSQQPTSSTHWSPIHVASNSFRSSTSLNSSVSSLFLTLSLSYLSLSQFISFRPNLSGQDKQSNILFIFNSLLSFWNLPFDLTIWVVFGQTTIDIDPTWFISFFTFWFLFF